MKKIITISHKQLSKKYEITAKEFEDHFYSKRIYDIVKIPYSEFNLLITGGSTDTGTPLDSSISQRGYKKTKLGRKYGNYIDDSVVQINLKVITEIENIVEEIPQK